MNGKYNVLYEGILNNTVLTTKNLKEMGYTRPTSLVKDGILKRVKRGYYELCDVHELFSYGKLFERDNNEKYFEVLSKCVELDPSYEDGLFNLFLYALRKKDYNSSFNYLVKLIELGGSYKGDYNLYLVLLSRIIELPQEYQEKVNKLNIFDIYASNSDRRFENRDMENRIRKAFFDGYYENAFGILKQFNTDGAPKVVYFQFLKKFIVKDKKEKPYSHLEAAKSHDYLTMKQYLERIDSLNKKNTHLLELINSYLAIKDTGLIPEVTLYNRAGLYAMLDSNDYEAAFNYVQNDSNKDNNPFYYILSDILELIRKKKIEASKTYTFDDVVLTLINGDNYLLALKRYLEQNNKSQYEKLLLAFIELGLYEKDTSFMSFGRYLYDIIYDRLNIDFSKYQLYFMQAIQDRDFNATRLYLNIIKAGNELRLNSINIGSLEYLLDNKEREYKREQSKIIISDAINEVLNTKGLVLIPRSSINMALLDYYLRQYQNVSSFEVGEMLAIRYFENKLIDLYNISRIAEYNYKTGEFESCIKDCLVILNNVAFVKPFVYQIMGLSYYYIGNLLEAKKFLSISEIIGKYDNSHLIKKIDKILEEELKRKREENKK